MKNGALRNQLEDYFRARSETFAAAYIFGSVAKGTERSESDLDIAIVPQGEFTANAKIQLIDDLAQIAERPVDVVNLSTASGPILKTALTTGIQLANTDSAKNADAISRMLAYETDLAPQIKAAEQQQVQTWINS
jgi:predicted nucleotidyltransferase